jgi:hypothetical protein
VATGGESSFAPGRGNLGAHIHSEQAKPDANKSMEAAIEAAQTPERPEANRCPSCVNLAKISGTRCERANLLRNNFRFAVL